MKALKPLHAVIVTLVLALTVLPLTHYVADQTQAADSFSGRRVELHSPAYGAAAVTPHDSNELAQFSRALYVGGTGDIAVTMVNGDNVTFTAVPAGDQLPIRVKIVKATGTTATSITALY